MHIDQAQTKLVSILFYLPLRAFLQFQEQEWLKLVFLVVLLQAFQSKMYLPYFVFALSTRGAIEMFLLFKTLASKNGLPSKLMVAPPLDNARSIQAKTASIIFLTFFRGQ